jgi:hypothetical protein
MKTVAALLVCLLSAAAATPSEIDGLIDQARSLAGEFAADGLIRIAGSEKLSAERKIELLNRAYERAAEAQQSFKRHAGVNPPGYAVGFINRAYEQDLDGLSLHLRAIEAMLPLDGRRARQMFLDLGSPHPPQVGCEEFLVYDVSRYYSVLGRVAAETFTAEEIGKGEPVRLLARFTGALTSAVEIGPAAQAIAGAKVKDEDFQSLVTAFAGVLGGISGDDRSFSASQQAAAQIQSLVAECRRRQMSPLPLIEGFRLHLVTNLTGKRCADDDLAAPVSQGFGVASSGSSNRVGDAVAYFNDVLQIPPIQPIKPDETVASSLEGKVKVEQFCQDAECRAIRDQFEGLFFGPNSTPHPNSYRDTNEFRGKLRDFLSAMAAWKESSGATPAEYFREKVGIFSELFSLVGADADRDAVTSAELDYLNQNRFQSENAIEWFLPVNMLVGQAGMAPVLRGVAERLREAQDPVMAFYARLESMVPRTPGEIMPLL